MNRKAKAVIIVPLIMIAAVLAVYVSPTLAYLNGTTDQTRDRDRDRLKDQTCTVNIAAQTLSSMNDAADQTQDRDRLRLRDRTCCDNGCPHSANQTRTQLRLHECAQNQINAGEANTKQQYRYQYRFTH